MTLKYEYGKQIIKELSEQLTEEYGKGSSKRQLHLCVNFASIFTDKQIVHTLCTQLSSAISTYHAFLLIMMYVLLNT